MWRDPFRVASGIAALQRNRRVIVAVVAHVALLAHRLGLADPPAVQDQCVRRSRPARLRKRLAQLLLDDFRIVGLGDANPVRHSQHMTIDWQPWYPERVAEDDVGGLATDAGQRRERVHVRRNISPVLLDEDARGADDGFRFRAKKTRRANLGFEIFRCGFRERGGIRVAREEPRRHQVHARVGGLRRQDRGDEQLERVAMVQLRIRAGMLAFKLVEDRTGFSGGFQGITAHG